MSGNNFDRYSAVEPKISTNISSRTLSQLAADEFADAPSLTSVRALLKLLTPLSPAHPDTKALKMIASTYFGVDA